MTSAGRRVSYDKFWGLVLALTLFLPARLDGPAHLFARLAAESDALVVVWLLLNAAAALFALAAGFAGWSSRWRHFLNFLQGVILLALPMVAPRIWTRFPQANPGRLPVGDLASVGWVLMLALAAIYAGSGIRVVRPSQIVGQALAALGALLVAVFAFLPLGGRETSYGLSMVLEFTAFRSHWRELVPFSMFAVAALCGLLNMVRTRAELALARLARVWIVLGMLFWLALPFLESGERLGRHLPLAWGAIRFLAPLFLSLDGAIAYVAITITRSAD